MSSETITAGAALIAVRVELAVTSTVAGRAGHEVMATRMRFPAVPREGDWVELAHGYAASKVRTVIFRDEGEPLVQMHEAKTDDPEALDSLAQLVGAYGWECPGWRLGGISDSDSGS